MLMSQGSEKSPLNAGAACLVMVQLDYYFAYSKMAPHREQLQMLSKDQPYCRLVLYGKVQLILRPREGV